MCDVWHHPSRPQEEIGPDVYGKLPAMFFTNITGGEPFIRQDLPDIVKLLKNKYLEAAFHTLYGIREAGYYKPDLVHIHAAGPVLIPNGVVIPHQVCGHSFISACKLKLFSLVGNTLTVAIVTKRIPLIKEQTSSR